MDTFSNNQSVISSNSSLSLSSSFIHNVTIGGYYWLYKRNKFTVIKITNNNENEFSYIKCNIRIKEGKGYIEEYNNSKNQTLPNTLTANLSKVHMKSININERNFMLIPISKNIPELIYNIKYTLTNFVMFSDKHILITKNDSYLKQMSIYNNHFVILNTSNQLNYVNYCMKYMQMYSFDSKFKIIKYFI